MDFYITLLVDLINTVVWLSFPFQLLTFKKQKKYMVISTLIFVILEAINILVRINVDLYDTPIKTILIMGLIMVLYITCFKEKLPYKIIGCFGFYIILGITEISAFATFYLLGIPIDQINLIHNIATLGYVFFSYFLFLVFKSIFNKSVKNKKFSSELWRFHIILASQFISTLLITYIIFMNENIIADIIFGNPTLVILLFVYFIVSLLADFFLYKVLVTNSENYEIKQALQIAKKKEELEYEYYNKLKVKADETDKLNHDMLNMLTIIKSLTAADSTVSKEQAATMIDDLTNKVNKNRTIKYCNNDILNIIISNKIDSSETSNIEFSANIDIPSETKIENIDLCRIFTNLLDNAICSCENSVDSNNLFVVLHANYTPEQLSIYCSNYCDASPKLVDNKFVSNKKNHKGLGIEILNNVAEKYNGKITTEYNQQANTFNTTIIMNY